METKSSTWEKALTWLGGISLILGVVKAIFDLTNPIESNWWLPFTLLLAILTIPLFLKLLGKAFTKQKSSSIELPEGVKLPAKYNLGTIMAVGVFVLFYGFIGFNLIYLSYAKTVPVTPFPPAQSGESLIIIAEFDNSHAKKTGFDAPNRIYSLITANKPKTEHMVRVEKLSETVSNQEQARQILKTYHATLVIWGYHDDGGGEAFVELDQNKVLSTQSDFNLATPESFAFKKISSQASYLAFFSLGMMYMTAETYDIAMSFLTSAIDSTHAAGEAARPYPWEALMWRGNIYGWTGQSELALTDYTEAIALYPHREGYHNRGNTYGALGQYEQAIADYTKAIEIDPKYTDAYVGRGANYAALGQHEQAIADYTKAIEIDPKYAMAYYNRGATYGELGQHKQAIADYTKAIEIDPKYAMAYYNRGATYGELGQHKQAIADYTKAIEIDPKYASAYWGRGNTYGALGQYEQAIADYTKAIEIEPTYTDGYLSRGAAHRALSQHEQAIANYTKAIEINPKDALAYIHRGYAYGESGQHEQAIADYTKAIEIDPKDALAYKNRGYAYGELGQHEQAIADYSKAIEINPEEAEIYTNRGWNYRRMGQYEQAIADYSKAIGINPLFASAYVGLGNIYADSDQFDNAINNYQKALQIEENTYTYCVMGITFSKINNMQEATDAISKGLALGSEDSYPWCKDALDKIRQGTPVP
jgi:tetratricopeptide (TPR) repeat protein